MPASRKLGRGDAVALAKGARQVIVAKGRKVTSFEPAGKAGADLVDAMLGPTGNLRAPTIRSGETVIVGFDESVYAEKLG